MKQRIFYWDILKGFAIFLVILGHAIQFLSHKCIFYQDRCIEFIYSFHMPLFMIISGYFSYSLIHKNIVEVLKKQLIRLFIPSISWYFFSSSILLVLYSVYHGELSVFSIIDLFKNSFQAYWYLKSLFIVQVITTFLYMIKKNNIWWLMILTIIILLILPTFVLDYVNWFSMWPFFIIGVLTNKHKHIIENHSVIILISSVILFYCFLSLWDLSEYDIYSNKTSITFEYCIIAIKRLLIGITGSFTFIIIIKKVPLNINNKIMNSIIEVGQNTLGIYIIQRYIVERGLIKFTSLFDSISSYFTSNLLVHYLFISPIVSIITIYVSMLIIRIVKRNKIGRLILLGEK